MKRFILVESGWDVDGESFVVAETFGSYEKAEQAFREHLMMQLGYDASCEEDAEKFKRYYQKYVEQGKYDDFEEKFILKIVTCSD